MEKQIPFSLLNVRKRLKDTFHVVLVQSNESEVKLLKKRFLSVLLYLPLIKGSEIIN